MLIFPLFIPQEGCPFRCIFCDQHLFVSVKKITPEISLSALQTFCHNHQNDTKQIAFYGGTFTALSEQKRNSYYKMVEPFLDERTNLRISTRPDFIDDVILNWCKTHAVKTIELGIQDFDNQVLALSQRGYDRKTALHACYKVKQAGFELGIQLMLGLPGFHYDKSVNMISNAEMNLPISSFLGAQYLLAIKPDFLRLYPAIAFKGTVLWEMYESGKYQPLSLEEAIQICADYWQFAEKAGIKIIKMGIPSLEKGTQYVGPYHPHFGELVKVEVLIRKIVQDFHQGCEVFLSEKDVLLFNNKRKTHLTKLLNRLDLCSIKLHKDPMLQKGTVRIVK